MSLSAPVCMCVKQNYFMAFALDKQTVNQSWRSHSQKATCWLTWHATVAAVSLSTSVKLCSSLGLSFFFCSSVPLVQFSSLWTHLLFGHRRWNWLSLLPANGKGTQSNRRALKEKCGKNEELPLKSYTQKCLTKINEWDERIASNWSACRPCATLYSNQVKRINVDFTLTRTWRTLTPTLTHTFTSALLQCHLLMKAVRRRQVSWRAEIATATWSLALRAVKMKNCLPLHSAHCAYY